MKNHARRTYSAWSKVPRGSEPRALYLETANPRHYARVHRLSIGKWSEEAYDLLIVGGEDHHLGQAEEAGARWSRLEEWARQRFPMIARIEYRWSSEVREPIDGLGFIGRNPMGKPNVYIAPSDSSTGLTHGAIAGLLLTDLLCGRENEWAGLYDPGRTIPDAPPKISSAPIQRRRALRRLHERRRERLFD